jgi:hypothetical protein
VGTNAAPKNQEVIAEQERLVDGPMSDVEIALLRDIQAFIEFAIRNGWGFVNVLSVLGHDVNGIVFHGANYEQALSRGFLPKVTGYSEVGADSVDEPAESVE